MRLLLYQHEQHTDEVIMPEIVMLGVSFPKPCSENLTVAGLRCISRLIRTRVISFPIRLSQPRGVPHIFIDIESARDLSTGESSTRYREFQVLGTRSCSCSDYLLTCSAICLVQYSRHACGATKSWHRFDRNRSLGSYIKCGFSGVYGTPGRLHAASANLKA